MQCEHTDSESANRCRRPGQYQMSGLFLCAIHMAWTPAPPPDPNPAAPDVPQPAAPGPGLVPPSPSPSLTLDRSGALEVLHDTVTRFLEGRASILALGAANAPLRSVVPPVVAPARDVVAAEPTRAVAVPGPALVTVPDDGPGPGEGFGDAEAL